MQGRDDPRADHVVTDRMPQDLPQSPAEEALQPVLLEQRPGIDSQERQPRPPRRHRSPPVHEPPDDEGQKERRGDHRQALREGAREGVGADPEVGQRVPVQAVRQQGEEEEQREVRPVQAVGGGLQDPDVVDHVGQHRGRFGGRGDRLAFADERDRPRAPRPSLPDAFQLAHHRPFRHSTQVASTRVWTRAGAATRRVLW